MGQWLRRLRLDIMLCDRPLSPADFTNWPKGEPAILPDGRPVRTEADLKEWERVAFREPLRLP